MCTVGKPSYVIPFIWLTPAASNIDDIASLFSIHAKFGNRNAMISCHHLLIIMQSVGQLHVNCRSCVGDRLLLVADFLHGLLLTSCVRLLCESTITVY